MNDETKNQEQLLGTTDYLEAIGALKAMKNFLFIIGLICLLLTQGIFWLMRSGVVQFDYNDAQPTSTMKCSFAGVTALIAETTEIKVEPSEEAAKQIEQTAQALTQDIQKPSDSNAVVVEVAATKPKAGYTFNIKFSQLALLIKVCNFILIMTALLYSLMLLFSIKISLVGRLGGIRHISKAFLLSLFMLAFLLPWQLCFKGAISGAIYTPDELVNFFSKCANCSKIACKLIVYLRFTGLWLIVIILFVLAQMRSMSWAKATLRRLGLAS